MAEVEHVVREYVERLVDTVNGASVMIKDLQPGLRALAVHGEFQSIMSSPAADADWSKRRLVTNLEVASTIADLPRRPRRGPQPPLDGRTIAPPLLLRLWEMLDLPGSPFPKADCSTSLLRLSSLRNDIAHRNDDPADVLSQPGASAREVAGHIDNVELLLFHLAMTWDHYIRTKSFHLAPPPTV